LREKEIKMEKGGTDVLEEKICGSGLGEDAAPEFLLVRGNGS
jgi:hypothetical protein